jgi:hypothetical protein
MKLLSTLSALVLPASLLACSTGPAASPEPDGALKACTEEAKVCPDGSSVGRTGPNCEFAPCPTSEAPGAPTAEAGCKNECGNGTCEEVVCQAVGCPCSESKTSCPQDCK